MSQTASRLYAWADGRSKASVDKPAVRAVGPLTLAVTRARFTGVGTARKQQNVFRNDDPCSVQMHAELKKGVAEMLDDGSTAEEAFSAALITACIWRTGGNSVSFALAAGFFRKWDDAAARKVNACFLSVYNSGGEGIDRCVSPPARLRALASSRKAKAYWLAVARILDSVSILATYVAPTIARLVALQPRLPWQEAARLLSGLRFFGQQGTHGFHWPAAFGVHKARLPGFWAKELLLDVFAVDVLGWQPSDRATWTPTGLGSLRGLSIASGIPEKDLVGPTGLALLQGVWRQRGRYGWDDVLVSDLQWWGCECHGVWSPGSAPGPTLVEIQPKYLEGWPQENCSVTKAHARHAPCDSLIC